MAKTYNSNCYELAKFFLQDYPKFNNPETADTLAQVIQEAIDDFMTAASHAVSRACQ